MALASISQPWRAPRAGLRQVLSGGGEVVTPSYAGAQSINADGFTFEDNDTTAVGWGTAQNVDVNGTPQNNYARTDEIFVKRQGFSGVNVAATPVDTVTVMSRFRKRYAATPPNHTEWEDVNATPTPDEVRATLSDFVYASDTITNSVGTAAGVTNNSTLPYPLPIPCWLNAPYTRVSAADASKIYLFVDHAYARNGKPVAGVRISLNDGTTTITVDATAMTKKTFTASGLTVPCYEFAPDWSLLATDALVTIDALIYPHVGAVYQSSVDGSNIDHTANHGVLRVWNTSTTLRYAYVDPTSPSGTPTTSTVAATAAADPYDTIVNAAAALATAAGGTCDNAIIRLVEDTHTVADFSATAVSDAGILIEGAPGTVAANVICLHANVNDTDTIADITHWRNLKIQKDDSDFNSRWGSGATLLTKNYQCLENVAFELTGIGTKETAMWSHAGVLTLVNCTGDQLGQTIAFGTNKQETNAYGCAGGAFGDDNTSCLYNAVGCDAQGVDTEIKTKDAATNRQASLGQCLAFNKISKNSTGRGYLIADSLTIGVRGASLSGSVIEAYGANVDPTIQNSSDGSDSPSQNVVANQITAVGGRVNWLYAPATTATTATKRGFLRNAILKEINTKADIFETDATSLGNEASFYRVGMRNLMLLFSSANSDFYGPANWIGEVEPLNATKGVQAGPAQNPGFVADKSNDGDDLGNGDYTPTVANMASDLVPAADVCFLCDLDGTNWALDGTDAKGALGAIA